VQLGVTKRLVDRNVTLRDLTGPAATEPIDLDGAQTLSVQCVVKAPPVLPRTFDSGSAATLVVQDLTYKAVTLGPVGNNITVEYEDTATAGFETVEVLGFDLVVGIQAGVSTAAQIKAAFERAPDALRLVSVEVNGNPYKAQDTAPETPLANGTPSHVNAATSSLTLPSHDFPVGLKGELCSTGVLPEGLSTLTNYFVIPVDAKTVRLARSYEDALAGVAVQLHSQGSEGAVHTFLPAPLEGLSVRLQKSNDKVHWSDVSPATSASANDVVWLEKDNPGFKWARVAYTVTSGAVNTDNFIVVKG
jgi:hypothetical protein